ncbi:hypothetical protein KAU11_09075 [Candidatus Babeliales bacterium]|nr:hypothetical protein [Candidatus Babeliales bacterium]
MPFEKDNQLWVKGVAAKKEKKKALNEFLSVIANGGRESYADKLENLSNSTKLTEEESDFMDRFEKLFPYVVPKLSSITEEVTHKGTVNLIDLHGARQKRDETD